jgi:hypothetical protein
MTADPPAPEAEPEISSIEFTPAEVVPWLCQLQLCDGDIFVHNLDQFEALTGAIATQNRAGQLFVLTEKLGWVSVEKLHEKPHGALRSIKATAKT